MKYNGSSWESVGSAGFSDAAATYTSLNVYNGTPYVAYNAAANSNKVTVMKYNGSLWELVGNAGFSSGTSVYISLKKYNGTPCVAYNDSSNQATAMLYDGSSWQNIGDAGFSPGSVDYTSLDIYNGTAYVAYANNMNMKKTTVMMHSLSSPTLTASPTASVLITMTITPTPSITATASPTQSMTLSPAISATGTMIPARTATRTITSTPMNTCTATPAPHIFNADAEGYAIPNPFVPGHGQNTQFVFSQTECTVTIYNRKGHVVRTLVNSKTWDGRNKAGRLCEGGLYLFQVRTDKQVLSGTVVLVAD